MTLALTVLLSAPAAAQSPAELDLNKMSAGQLAELPGIGRVTAERIVRIRERNGPYLCIEELRAVPRLTEAQFKTLDLHLAVRSPDPRCQAQESARRAGQPLQHPN